MSQFATENLGTFDAKYKEGFFLSWLEGNEKNAEDSQCFSLRLLDRMLIIAESQELDKTGGES